MQRQVHDALASLDAKLTTDRQVQIAAEMSENVTATRRLQHSMNRHLHVVAHVQVMVEWIEVFLVSVYLAHLSEMIVSHIEALHHYIPWIVGGAALLGFIVAGALLRPWQNKVDSEHEEQA